MAPPKPSSKEQSQGPSKLGPSPDADKGETSRAQEEDDAENEDDDDESDETQSNFSFVSVDSLAPIEAYGFTYHGSGRVFMPNDEGGARLMRVQHEVYRLVLNGRLTDCKLPIEDTTSSAASSDASSSRDDSSSLNKPHHHQKYSVLDVGSGTGQWAVEMALRYPDATILGTELSATLLPKDVPPNLTFEIADFEEPWPSPLYDLVHLRNLACGRINFERLVNTSYDHVKPGGQIEFTAISPAFFGVDPLLADLPDGEVPEIGAACREFVKLFAGMSKELGLDFDPVSRAAGWLTDAGAECVKERCDYVPVRIWGHDPAERKKGEVVCQMVEHGLEQWSMMVFGACGWTPDATRGLISRVIEEIQNPKLRSLVKITFITGKKPKKEGNTKPVAHNLVLPRGSIALSFLGED